MRYEENDSGQRKVERAMELLILAVYEAQRDGGPALERLRETNPKGYLHEYCTVRVSAPRQAGHSTAIARQMYLNYCEGILCRAVTPVQALVDHWSAPTSPKFEIVSIGSLEQTEAWCVMLFVDNATFLTKGKIRAIEDYALRCIKRNPQFILVYVQ